MTLAELFHLRRRPTGERAVAINPPPPIDWEKDPYEQPNASAEELSRAAERQVDAAAYVLRRLFEDLRPYLLGMGLSEPKPDATDAPARAMQPDNGAKRARVGSSS